MKLSIIVPCHNEAEMLPRTLQTAREACPGSELIVVDAGSTDGTPELATALTNRVMSSPVRQRASQMNLGARLSSGDTLMFLHADTLLPAGAEEKLAAVLSQSGVAGGGFARRFDSPSPFLRITCLLSEARCRAFGWFLGDQAIFARRTAFDRLGGYRDLDRFEDLDFARRLKAIGRVTTLRPAVLTSARRFAREGPMVRTWRDFVLTIRYLRGEPGAIRVPGTRAGETGGS